jgi:hypothetical protein
LQSLVERYGQSRAQIQFFDPQAPVEERRRVIGEWRKWWERLDKRSLTHPGSEVPLDENFQIINAKIEKLLARQDQSEISIGE